MIRKKAQIGSTLTWIVAFLIIVFIMAVFLIIVFSLSGKKTILNEASTLLSEGDNKIGSFSNSSLNKIVYIILQTKDDKGETLYESISKLSAGTDKELITEQNLVNTRIQNLLRFYFPFGTDSSYISRDFNIHEFDYKTQEWQIMGDNSNGDYTAESNYGQNSFSSEWIIYPNKKIFVQIGVSKI